MKGKHQIENASLALMAIDYLYFFFGLSVEIDELKTGLESAFLKGRFEELSEQPLIVLDGAHNAQATACLADTIVSRFPNHSIHIIFAALDTKDVRPMIANLEKVADQMTLTSFSHPKALSVQKLQRFATMQNLQVEPDVETALDDAVKNGGESTAIIVTGSLYFISEVRKLLCKQS